MKDTRVTAAEVAKRAGVSQPTVSRVFTPGLHVSKIKEERVREAARELGYLPNTLARSLNTGRSRTIGLVLANLKNPFSTEALQRFSRALRDNGYHLLVFFANDLDEDVDAVVEDLLAHQVDGIILASVSTSIRLTSRLDTVSIPFVLFNRGQEDRSLPSVTASNFDGGRQAGRFLASSGHRRIAHIAGWQKSVNGRERQEGFIAGLAEFGLEPISCIDCHFKRDMAVEATIALFADATRPEAIFVGNDDMAFGVIETLRFTLGLHLPNDVSVVGFDDVTMAAWPSFDLTTLRQPAEMIVDTTVEMLLDMIETGKRPEGRVEISTALIVRGSARIPEGWPDERL